MPDRADHYTTIVGLTGKDDANLHVLANISPTVNDPDSIWSVFVNLKYRPQSGWTRQHMLQSWLTSMDEAPSGELYAVSMDGELVYSEQGSWKTMNLGCQQGLNAIWAASDTELFVVGLSGCLGRISALQVHMDRDPNRRRLNAVHGRSTSNVWAVGDNGIIFHYDGRAWTEVESPTNVALLAVLCRGTDVYIAGAEGTLFRRTDETWHELHASEEITITSLAWYGEHLFAAAGLNGILRLQSDELETFKERAVYNLTVAGDLLIAFGNNFITRFDGSGWRSGNLEL